MNAERVREALRLRHPEAEGEWVVLEEWAAIDVLAVRCWTGGIGCRRIAYEVKVSRSDFRRELARPGKRRLAVEVSHAYVFAMPWPLAQQVKGDVPKGLGLVGVVEHDGRAVARQIVRPAVIPPRPLDEREVASIVRHRAQPPALRNALLERHDRNQEIRRLRATVAKLAAAVAASLRPGDRLRFPGLDDRYGHDVLDPPRMVGGRWRVRCRTVSGWRDPVVEDVDLVAVLAAGYRPLQQDAGEQLAGAAVMDEVA